MDTPQTPDPAAPVIVPAPPRVLTPSEASRTHLDAIEIAQVLAPALVACTIILGYVALVWHGEPGDGILGTAIPLIVATYFVGHAATTRHRRGP